MQTLGLSESTPRTDSRLKSLFWPSITSGADVDYLGAQGYWVCSAIAILTLVVMAASDRRSWEQPFSCFTILAAWACESAAAMPLLITAIALVVVGRKLG